MRFVDAHMHLSDNEYVDCVDDVMADAKNANVVALVSNSVNFETSIASLKLAEKYRGTVYAALGIHPSNVRALAEGELQKTVELISQQRQNSSVVAVGEVGLDSKYEGTWNEQLKVFGEMLSVAEKLELSVIVHSRGATTQVIEMLPSYNLKRILLHWFSYPISILDKALQNGYYISEGPPAAYSEGIREVIRKTPLTSLLTETDGPVRYFKQPFKGKRTTPVFIPAVVKAIAEIKCVDVEIAAEQITRNFEGFFGVKLN